MTISTLDRSYHILDTLDPMSSSRASERSTSQPRARASYRESREVLGRSLLLIGGDVRAYLNSESLILLSSSPPSSHCGVDVSVDLGIATFNYHHLFSEAVKNRTVLQFIKSNLKDTNAKFSKADKDSMYATLRNVAGRNHVSTPPVLDDVLRFVKGIDADVGDVTVRRSTDVAVAATVPLTVPAAVPVTLPVVVDADVVDVSVCCSTDVAVAATVPLTVPAAVPVTLPVVVDADVVDVSVCCSTDVAVAATVPFTVPAAVPVTVTVAADAVADDAADVAAATFRFFDVDDLASSRCPSVAEPAFTRRDVSLPSGGERFYAGLPSVLYGGAAVWAGGLVRVRTDTGRDSVRPWTKPPPSVQAVGCNVFQFIASSASGNLSLLVRPPRLSQRIVTVQNWAPETNAAQGYAGLAYGGSGANSPPGTIRISPGDVDDVLTWSSSEEAATLWRVAFTRPAPYVAQPVPRAVAQRPKPTESVHRKQHQPLPPPAVRSCSDALTPVELGTMLLTAVRIGMSPRAVESGVDAAWVAPLIPDVKDIMVVNDVARALTTATGATSRTTLERVLRRVDADAVMRRIGAQTPEPTLLVTTCCEDVLLMLGGRW
jgi:hypothetical protein